MRIQADLVDSFSNPAKSVWREILLMAEFGKPGEPETVIPKVTQETLGGNDRHHAVPRQLLRESLPQGRHY
jgi:hypothetical protein